MVNLEIIEFSNNVSVTLDDKSDKFDELLLACAYNNALYTKLALRWNYVLRMSI